MSYLAVDSISKKYGNRQALSNLSFSVNRSEIVALVGPDGAGKTTAIKIICDLLSADNGEVLIDNKPFKATGNSLGYMPQQFSLYPDLSVEENLSFYAGLFGIKGDAYKKKRDYLYSFSNLAPFAKRRAEKLSGGMKQKLALSCSLMHNPELLILDEPTTGVDPLSRRQFWEILLQLKEEGVTILVSTPYMDEVSRSDRGIFIFDGHQLSSGTPVELADQFEGQIYYLNQEPTFKLIEGINLNDGLQAVRFGAGVHIYLSKDDDINRYSDKLQSSGLNLSELSPKKPTLEDRFIQLMEQTG